MSLKYLKQLLLDKKWLFAVYSIVLILTYSIFALDEDSNNISFNFVIATTVIYFAFLSLFTFIQFSYFHTKSSVDFYHSLPIKREKLFITNFLIVPILATIPYILINIICIYYEQLFHVPAYNPQEFYETIRLAKILLLNMTVLSMFMYTFLVFCSTITGSIISHGFISLVTFAGPIILLVFSSVIAYHTINEGFSPDAVFTPIINFLFILSEDGDVIPFSPQFFAQIFIIIVLFISSFILYKKYKSESASTFLTSNLLTSFYVILSSLITSVFITAIFLGINGTNKSNQTYFIIPFLILMVVAYFIFTKVFNGINARFVFNLKTFIVLMVVAFIYILALFFDVFKIGTNLPNNIEKVVLNGAPFYGEQIDDVIEIFEKASEEGVIHTTSKDTNLEIIQFKFDNTGRLFYIPVNSTIYDDLSVLFTTEEYKKNNINYIEKFKATNDLSINIDGPSYSYGIYKNDSSENEYNNKQANDFIDALIKDIEADEDFGLYNYQLQHVYRVNFYTNNNYREIYELNQFSNIAVKNTYVNTLKLIQEEMHTKSEDENSNIYENVAISTFKFKPVVEQYNTALQNGENYFELNFEDKLNPAATIDVYDEKENSYSKNEDVYDIKEYSYSRNKEELIEFLNTQKFYTSPNSYFIKVEPNKEIYCADFRSNSRDANVHPNSSGVTFQLMFVK